MEVINVNFIILFVHSLTSPLQQISSSWVQKHLMIRLVCRFIFTSLFSLTLCSCKPISFWENGLSCLNPWPCISVFGFQNKNELWVWFIGEEERIVAENQSEKGNITLLTSCWHTVHPLWAIRVYPAGTVNVCTKFHLLILKKSSEFLWDVLELHAPNTQRCSG